MQEIKVTLTKEKKAKPAVESKLGFGKLFTDHMFLLDYAPDLGWHDARIVPYGPFAMDPASMVFHYGQAIFEGTKCYHAKDGSLQLFRPMDNFLRMNHSAERMCIPQLDADLCMASLIQLLQLEKEWVPHAPGTSLYIRPFIIATDPFLGVHASKTYRFAIILSPSGAYYTGGLAPVGIYVEDEYVRAVRGGVGHAKAAGNYAASILAAEMAEKKGYVQVLWLDGVERRYVEEVGAMNMMFVYGDKVVTPALSGSILPGITRDSILKLASYLGYEVEEGRLAIDDIFNDIKSGKLTEAFGTGTAAVVSPVGELCFKGEKAAVGDGGIGRVTRRLYDTLTGIQLGQEPDPFGWVVKLPD
jgi:branched-chain amino acid aminotransferase